MVAAQRDTVSQALPLRIGITCLWIAALGLPPRAARALSVDGDVTYTSDYIFRGISETGGHGAAQLDVHLTTLDGTFVGAFASTLGRTMYYHWNDEMQTYIGHRFDISPSWSTTLTAVNYAYLGGNVRFSNDYQELSLAASYLDRLTLSVFASPNAVRYDMGYRLGRYPAYGLDASTQLPVVGRLLFTAAIGYYSVGDGSEALGYVYGNSGLAFEYKSLRVDAGYYVVQKRAQDQFPYGRARDRIAGTISWHF
jgi:uncharacterized protein (TIGR02001 family)